VVPELQNFPNLDQVIEVSCFYCVMPACVVANSEVLHFKKVGIRFQEFVNVKNISEKASAYNMSRFPSKLIFVA
jgi:hypothetical protein